MHESIDMMIKIIILSGINKKSHELDVNNSSWDLLFIGA